MAQQPLECRVIYHIYNRGNNGETIFLEARNFDYFMQLYNKYIAQIADTYAYCLLRNHFHIMLRIKNFPIQEEAVPKATGTVSIAKGGNMIQ